MTIVKSFVSGARFAHLFLFLLQGGNGAVFDVFFDQPFLFLRFAFGNAFGGNGFACA